MTQTFSGRSYQDFYLMFPEDSGNPFCVIKYYRIPLPFWKIVNFAFFYVKANEVLWGMRIDLWRFLYFQN